MFWIILISGLLTCFLGGATISKGKSYQKALGILIGMAGIVLIPGAFATPQGNLYWQKFMATASSGSWLVIDNSGGETMRHWVLEDAYVTSSSQSDGWQFYDAEGNLCYVSGDAYVMQIKNLDEFKPYKKKYNIPPEQQALK